MSLGIVLAAYLIFWQCNNSTSSAYRNFKGFINSPSWIDVSGFFGDVGDFLGCSWDFTIVNNPLIKWIQNKGMAKGEELLKDGLEKIQILINRLPQLIASGEAPKEFSDANEVKNFLLAQDIKARNAENIINAILESKSISPGPKHEKRTPIKNGSSSGRS